MWTHWGEAREGDEGDGNGSGQGDIELGAIVPRYYGYWVHDEECGCRQEAERGKRKEEGKAEKAGGGEAEDKMAEDGSNGEKEKKEEQKLDLGYFSDILLMENCGTPLEGKRLRTAEKKQIHTLLQRFHSYGWTHGSPYERNIVWDWGPINRDMSRRPTGWDDRKLSFRLIDFGRAEYHEVWDTDQESGQGEQSKMKKWEEACAKEMRSIRADFVA